MIELLEEKTNETSASTSFQQFEDLKKSRVENIILGAKSAVVFAAPLLFSTAHALTSEIKQDLMTKTISESSEKAQPLAEEIATLLNRFEEKVFAYPGTVIEVEKNVSGDATSVLINVSINGKSHMVKKSVNQLNFEVQPDMPLVIEGIKRGTAKKLRIKKAEPVSLSNNDLELLKKL